MYILVCACVCVYTQLGSYHNTVQDLLPPQLKCNLYAFLYQHVQIHIIFKYLPTFPLYGFAIIDLIGTLDNLDYFQFVITASILEHTGAYL